MHVPCISMTKIGGEDPSFIANPAKSPEKTIPGTSQIVCVTTVRNIPSLQCPTSYCVSEGLQIISQLAVDKHWDRWHPKNILLMEEILHQLIGSLSHYLQGFIHPGGAGFLPSTVPLSSLECDEYTEFQVGNSPKEPRVQNL